MSLTVFRISGLAVCVGIPTVVCLFARRWFGRNDGLYRHEDLRAAATDDDGCQPDCNPADLHQVASDEVECSVCGFRRAAGDDA